MFLAPCPYKIFNSVIILILIDILPDMTSLSCTASDTNWVPPMSI
jgi:hypothetical protein